MPEKPIILRCLSDQYLLVIANGIKFHIGRCEYKCIFNYYGFTRGFYRA